jgi:hypothetical protein
MFTKKVLAAFGRSPASDPSEENKPVSLELQSAEPKEKKLSAESNGDRPVPWESKSADFKLRLANTPRSYELFDTLAEEIEAKTKYIQELENKKNQEKDQKDERDNKENKAKEKQEEKLESKIKEEKDEYYSYFLYGCHGSGNEDQQKVADWMKAFLESKGFAEHNENINKDFKIDAFPERMLSREMQSLPRFAIPAGDLGYDDGMNSPNDPSIKRVFYAIYSMFLIYFQVLGNHDCNRHQKSYIHSSASRFLFNFFPAIRGIEVAANIIAHTYSNSEGLYDPSRFDYLTQPYINLETLLKNKYQSFLPSRCYEFTYKGTTFLMMDSNHIGDDFIKYHDFLEKIKLIVLSTIAENEKLSNPDISPEEKQRVEQATAKNDSSINQLFEESMMKDNPAYWYEQALIRHPHTRKILVWHHPIFTPGKRALDYKELYYYFDNPGTQFPALKNYFKKYGLPIDNCLQDLSTVLKNILMCLKMSPTKETIQERVLAEIKGTVSNRKNGLAMIDALHCAHQHFKMVSKEDGIFQIISGGGGGDKLDMEVKTVDKLKNVALLTKTYGFDLITLSSDPKKEIYAEIFNTKGEYWLFNNKSLEPIFNFKHFPSEQYANCYKEIRLLLLKACHQCLNTPAAAQEFSHALELIDKLNESIPKDVDSLFKFMRSCPPLLGSLIEKKMKKINDSMLEHGVTLSDSFALEIEDIHLSPSQSGSALASSYAEVRFRKS